MGPGEGGRGLGLTGGWWWQCSLGSPMASTKYQSWTSKVSLVCTFHGASLFHLDTDGNVSLPSAIHHRHVAFLARRSARYFAFLPRDFVCFKSKAPWHWDWVGETNTQQTRLRGRRPPAAIQLCRKPCHCNVAPVLLETAFSFEIDKRGFVTSDRRPLRT